MIESVCPIGDLLCYPLRSLTLKYGKGQGERISQQFPLTSWDLLADASSRGDQSATALNEFAERYYAAVHAFIGALTRGRGDPEDLTQRFFETVVLSGRLL